jgi:hypothetical protein
MINKSIADGCLVRATLTEEDLMSVGGASVMRLGKLMPCTSYRFVVWYDDKPCPTSFKGCHSRCFTTLPPPPSWGPRSYWPVLSLAYSASSPLPSVDGNVTIAPAAKNSRNSPHELTFMCAGLDLLHDYSDESEHNHIKVNPTIRLMLGLPRDDGDTLLHRTFFNVEKTLRQLTDQSSNEFSKEAMEIADGQLRSVIRGAFERCINCAHASAHMKSTTSSNNEGVISEREECATMFLLKSSIPGEWRHRYPFTVALLLKQLEAQEIEETYRIKKKLRERPKKENNLKQKLERKKELSAGAKDTHIDEDLEDTSDRFDVELKEDMVDYFKDDVSDGDEADGEHDDDEVPFASNRFEENGMSFENAEAENLADSALREKEIYGFSTHQCGPLTIIELGDVVELSAEQLKPVVIKRGGGEILGRDGEYYDEEEEYEMRQQDMIRRSGGWHEENLRKFLESLDDEDTNTLLFISPLPLVTAKSPSTMRSGWSMLTAPEITKLPDKHWETESEEKVRLAEEDSKVEKGKEHVQSDPTPSNIRKEVKTVLSELVDNISLSETSSHLKTKLDVVDQDWETDYEHEQNEKLIPVGSGNCKSFEAKKSYKPVAVIGSAESAIGTDAILDACSPPRSMKCLNQTGTTLDSFVRIVDRLLTWTAHGGVDSEMMKPLQPHQRGLRPSASMMEKIKEDEEFSGGHHVDALSGDDDIDDIDDYLGVKASNDKNLHRDQSHKDLGKENQEESESLREVVIVCHDPNATEHHVELTFTRYMPVYNQERRSMMSQYEVSGDGLDVDDDASIDEQRSFLRVIVLAGGTNVTNVGKDDIHLAHASHHHHSIHHTPTGALPTKEDVVIGKEGGKTTNLEKKKDEADIKEEDQPALVEEEEEEEEEEEVAAIESLNLEVCSLDSKDISLWREAVMRLPQVNGVEKYIEVSLRVAPARCDGKSKCVILYIIWGYFENINIIIIYHLLETTCIS